MDKNFVNIDDLVRQRLEGREEQEPPGAWLRMRELLDEEMPRKRGAFVYWRKFFNVTAIALMTTSIGIGTYHMATSHGGPAVLAGNETPAGETNAVNGELAAVATTQTTTVPSQGDAAREDAASAPGSAVAVTGGSGAVAGNSSYRSHLTDTHANVRVRNNDALMKLLAQNGIDLNKKNNEPAAASVPDRQLLAMNEKFNSYNDNHYRAIVAGTSVSARRAAVKVDDAPVAASAPGSNANTPHTAMTAYRHVAGTAGHVAAKPVETSQTTVNVPNTAATANTGGTRPVAANTGSRHTGRHHSRIANNRRAGSKGTETVAVPGSIAVANGSSWSGQQARKPIAQDMQGTAADRTATAATPVSAGNSASKAPVGNSVPVSGAPLAAAPVTTLPKDVKPATQDAMQQASAANMSKGKKVMEKMVLFEHYIKTTPSEGYYKMDTISYETFTQDNNKTTPNAVAEAAAAATADNMSPAGKAANGTAGKIAATPGNAGTGTKGHKKGAKGATTANLGLAANASSPASKGGNQAATGRNINAEENDGEENVNNENVLAASAGTAAAIKPGLLANEQAKTKKSTTGFSTAEKLTQTFNDVKMKALGARFVPGLTAGISSTFFGPASFNGFHFGVTGTLVFDDVVSLQAELKYFHRINSNFAIDDNYYNYTPVGAGQFAKQQELNSYGFSSLQSIEMPVSLRYRRGNFTIFAGANLVYTFAINTGAATVPSNSKPTVVSAQGTDNEPKLSERDFESRFGVGYLFGFAYEVSSNVTLDLRSVQTIWDNAGTSGARSISSQLYKNPSVQLSFGYKFGKRNK